MNCDRRERGDDLISDYALRSRLTTSTKPAPENLGPFSAFIIATAITGPVIIKTSTETRNAAADIEAVFLMMFDIVSSSMKRTVAGWVKLAGAGFRYETVFFFSLNDVGKANPEQHRSQANQCEPLKQHHFSPSIIRHY
jgi:hypothetical protein